MNPYEKFAKEICHNCKGICEKGIVVTYHKDFIQAKCSEYIQKEQLEGYQKPLVRTATQEASLMGFTQIY